MVAKIIRKVLAPLRNKGGPVFVTGCSGAVLVINAGVGKVAVMKFGAVNGPGAVNSLVPGVPNAGTGLPGSMVHFSLRGGGVTVGGSGMSPRPPGITGGS